MKKNSKNYGYKMLNPKEKTRPKNDNMYAHAIAHNKIKVKRFYEKI